MLVILHQLNTIQLRCKKISGVQRAFQCGPFGQPRSCSNTHFAYKSSSFRQSQLMGMVLVGCWGMPGVGAPVALGDEQDNTQAETWADQTRCCFHHSSPDHYPQPDMLLAQECKNPCHKGGWKKLSFSMVIFPSPWAFSADVNKAVIKQIFANKKLPNLILGSKIMWKYFFWLFLLAGFIM